MLRKARQAWRVVQTAGNWRAPNAASRSQGLRQPRFGREFEHVGPHFLAGLEFHHGAGGNGHVGFRRVGIAADARLADFDLEDAEVAQFHLVALGERLGDVIERFLHHVEHLLLDEAGFIADANNQVTFCESHNFLSGFRVELIITERHGLSRNHWPDYRRSHTRMAG